MDVASLVEASDAEDTAACGIVSYFTKSFNRLPRRPVFHIIRRLGVPEGCLTVWQNYLGSLRRRFWLHGQLGLARALRRAVALSVVAMVILGTSATDGGQLPYSGDGVRIAIFADNVEAVATDPTQRSKIAYFKQFLRNR